MLSTRTAVLAAFAAAALGAPSAAEDWPSGDLRYILHVEPGGATDVMARHLADGLQRELGVNVVVENRPGGSGARQLAQMSFAERGGHTLGSVTISHLTMLQESSDFDVDSVEWACRLVLDPYLIAVPAESEIKSLEDLVESAKEEPNRLSIAGYGEREIAWLMFEEAADLERGDINWVPYNSVTDGIVAALGGHNDAVLAYVGLVREHVEAGNMRVLGVMSDERANILPDVPTFEEAGFDVDTGWMLFRGIIMPQGTPIEYQQALCDAVETVLQTSELQEYIEESELVYGYMPPEEFRAFVDRQEELTSTWLEQF